jgi:hypothetical protein
MLGSNRNRAHVILILVFLSLKKKKKKKTELEMGTIMKTSKRDRAPRVEVVVEKYKHPYPSMPPQLARVLQPGLYEYAFLE